MKGYTMDKLIVLSIWALMGAAPLENVKALPPHPDAGKEANAMCFLGKIGPVDGEIILRNEPASTDGKDKIAVGVTKNRIAFGGRWQEAGDYRYYIEWYGFPIYVANRADFKPCYF